MQILIAGAGNFGREVAGWMQWRGRPISGFLDDEQPNVRSKIEDYQPKDYDEVLVAISNPKGRQKVCELLMGRNTRFHTMAFLDMSPTAAIGAGNIWCPRSLASAGARIGNFVIVNTHSTIGHDAVIRDYCTISSHVDICGHVVLGERVFVGSGARILPGVQVGDDATIGAGAIVVKDVPAGATVYCEPGRIL